MTSEADNETKIREARMLSNLHYGVEPNPEAWNVPHLTVRSADEPDLEIAERLMAAFHCAIGPDWTRGDGLWNHMQQNFHGTTIEALEHRDVSALAEILSGFFFEPVASGLCSRNANDHIAASDPTTRMLTIDAVASLGLALGVLAHPNPASGKPPNLLETDPIETLKNVETKTGWNMLSPNCGGIAGLGFGDGVIHHKQLYQLYAAHRLQEINGGPLESCLEIGGGVGLLAHVCARNNVVRDYTLIDLPVVNVLQGYLMLKSSVADRVVLCGENEKSAGEPSVRILPDSALSSLKDKSFDMAVNQDSLPEMANETAVDYLNAFTRLVRGQILSINHESAAPWGAGFNHGIVNQLAANVKGLHKIGRFPYWMRGGYVEEIFTVQN